MRFTIDDNEVQIKVTIEQVHRDMLSIGEPPQDDSCFEWHIVSWLYFGEQTITSTMLTKEDNPQLIWYQRKALQSIVHVCRGLHLAGTEQGERLKRLEDVLKHIEEAPKSQRTT